MSSKKIKTPDQRIKKLRRWKRVVVAFEALFASLLIAIAVIWFVPGLKMQVFKALAGTDFGKQIIRWIGSASYEDSVLDTNFDSTKVKTNDLTYNYSEEYTNFVLFGVDSRNGEVDASNSDSILIVSIHNTTGEVKMVSVYRDTFLGIYDANASITNYFKVNSAYAGGGPEAAINTLNMNLDLDISDYVTVNFGGVADIIDTLGGIKVNLTDDEVAQLNHHLKSTLSSTGRKTDPVSHSGKNIKLNGLQATTYCRIRKATFIDPTTGEEVRDDFGRAARQRLVMNKLIDRAKSASVSELTDMVSAVMGDNTKKSRIISTSFTFDEIVNLLPVIFDFELKGSQGFPAALTTGTISGASYVIPSGLAANVKELHKFLFNEEDYVATSNVQAIDGQITSYTGVSEYSPAYDPLAAVEAAGGSGSKEPESEEYYDYDDKGKSDFY